MVVVARREITWLEFIGLCSIVAVVGGVASGLLESSLPAVVVLVVYRTALWMTVTGLAYVGLKAWRAR